MKAHSLIGKPYSAIIASNNIVFCIFAPGAANVPSHDGKSVSPDLRTARMSYSCGSSWGEDTRDDVIPNKLVHYAKTDFYKYGTGVYYNEPDYFLEDWKVIILRYLTLNFTVFRQSFRIFHLFVCCRFECLEPGVNIFCHWFYSLLHLFQTDYWKTSDRYNRLLRVKQQWDPDNLFWCHHCVGSDLVTYQSEQPCETPFNSTAKPIHSRGTAMTCFSNISLFMGFLLVKLSDVFVF